MVRPIAPMPIGITPLSELTLLLMLWAAVAEMGVEALVGALAALVGGAVAVPVGEVTGAPPTTAQRPHGCSCLLYDRSSLDLPKTSLLSELICPRLSLHLHACEQCSGVDGCCHGQAGEYP
jgi:hypothetical protein